MNKIVYNACYGGFRLSEEAIMLYAQYKGFKVYPEKIGIATIYWTHENANSREWDKFQQYRFSTDFERHDPILVKVVEELGTEKASGQFAELRIYETDSLGYRIDEYDGSESVEVPTSRGWIIIK